MSNATTRHRTRGHLLAAVRLGAFAIFAAALAVSYDHLVELAAAMGETGWRAYSIAATVDTIILGAVAAGMIAEQLGGQRPAIIGQAMYAGIAVTLIGNVHHGLRANLTLADFGADGGLVPELTPIGWAQLALGVLVALWAPVVADLAYRLLLWSATVSVAAEPAGRHAEATPAAAPQHTDENGAAQEPVAVQTPSDPPDPDGATEAPPADDIDAQVFDIYDRLYRASQAPSERGLADIANDQLQLSGDEAITRHRARKIIRAWKTERSAPDTGPMPRLVASAS